MCIRDRFYGEYLCYDETCNASPRDITALLEGLCPEDAQTDDAHWRRVWLAGLLVPGWESRVKEKSRPKDLKPRIIQSLVKLVESPDALHTELAARAAVGRVLGQLGDPRPGVGVKNGLPDILWGSDTRNRAARLQTRFREREQYNFPFK